MSIYFDLWLCFFKKLFWGLPEWVKSCTQNTFGYNSPNCVLRHHGALQWSHRDTIRNPFAKIGFATSYFCDTKDAVNWESVGIFGLRPFRQIIGRHRNNQDLSHLHQMIPHNHLSINSKIYWARKCCYLIGKAWTWYFLSRKCAKFDQNQLAFILPHMEQCSLSLSVLIQNTTALIESEPDGIKRPC